MTTLNNALDSYEKNAIEEKQHKEQELEKTREWLERVAQLDLLESMSPELQEKLSELGELISQTEQETLGEAEAKITFVEDTKARLRKGYEDAGILNPGETELVAQVPEDAMAACHPEEGKIMAANIVQDAFDKMDATLLIHGEIHESGHEKRKCGPIIYSHDSNDFIELVRVIEEGLNEKKTREALPNSPIRTYTTEIHEAERLLHKHGVYHVMQDLYHHKQAHTDEYRQRMRHIVEFIHTMEQAS